MYWI